MAANMEDTNQSNRGVKRQKLGHVKSNAVLPAVDSRHGTTDSRQDAAQGQEPSERRRTQIRLAQRAYRERKEATITTLQSQVEALEKQLEIANRTIAELRTHTAAVVGTSSSTHVQALDNPVHCADVHHVETVQGVQAPVRQNPLRLEYRDDWLANPHYQPRAVELHHTIPSGNKIVELPMGIIEVKHRKAGTVPNPGQQTTGNPTTHVERVRSGETIHWLSTLAQSVESGPSPAEDTTSEGDLSTDAKTVHRYVTPETSATPTIIPNPSESDSTPRLGSSIYFNTESPFVRSLHLKGLRYGLHLLENWQAHQDAFLRVFRIPLLYNSREYITQRFRTALALGPNTGMNVFVTPFVHLGGAGLHYSSRKIRHSCLVRAIDGEPGKARLQSTEGSGLTYEVDLDLKQYEGDWYSTDDVEGFLRERGVHPDHDDRFVQAEIRIDDLRSMVKAAGARTSSSTYAVPINPRPVDIPEDLDTSLDVGAWPIDANDGSNTFAVQGPAKSSSFGLESVFLFPTPSTMKQFNASSAGSSWAMKSKKATLDLTKMMNELMEHGICLGRAPGFRKVDVERAFSRSIVSV